MKALLSPVFLGVACAALLWSCDRSCTVTISASIADCTEEDTVYVTLARNWSKLEEPTIFTRYQGGRFRIVQKIDGAPPGFTVVKNGRKVAELELDDLWRYHPSVVDKISGKRFPLTITNSGDVIGTIDL